MYNGTREQRTSGRNVTLTGRLLARIDWLLLFFLACLTALSLINLRSADPHGYSKQALFFCFGYVLIALLLCIDPIKLRRFAYLIYGGSLLLLISTLLLGKIAGGSQRWLDFGLFRLQSSEPTKLFLLLALARYFSEQSEKQPLGFKDLMVPALLTGAPFCLILLQPDLGTALMLVICLFAMLVVHRIRWSVPVFGGLGMVVVAPLVWIYVLHDYQRQRILIWLLNMLGLKNDPMGAGYQILQSKIAVGSGGWFGKGYLQGSQSHLHFLPERHTDFIFAVFAEEWGFVGCCFLLGCYLALLLKCLDTGLKASERFSLLLVHGIVQLLFWQIVINLLMVLGVLPVVGIPLPLFSFGGSSLITTFLAIGIIISIRFHINEK